MIITTSNKPLCIIGFLESTITQEGMHFFNKVWDDEITVIPPDEFLNLTDKTVYQYVVFFTLDKKQRQQIIGIIEEQNLDCFTYIDKTAVTYLDLETLPAAEIQKIIGKGTVISPFSSVLLNSRLGNHCLIETYCLVSHYVEIGSNVILHSGTMIAGRTKIENNCEFNFKSTVLNALSICEGVEIGAVSTVTKNIDRPGRYIGSIARYVGDIEQFSE